MTKNSGLVIIITTGVRINEHSMTGHKGNSEFCFPETLNEVEGKHNSLFPEGPVIKCVVIPPDSKLYRKNSEKNDDSLDTIAYTGRTCKIKRLPKPTCPVEKS